jgi:hypothetical protein
MRVKKISYYFIAIAIIVASILLAVFIYYDSYIRIFDSIKDLGRSFLYWFYNLIGSNKIPSVSVYDIVNHYGNIVGGGTNPPSIIIPSNSDLFKLKISIYFKSLFNIQNFVNYLFNILNAISYLARLFMILLPFGLVLYLYYKSYFKQNNNKTNSDSKALKLFKFFSLKVYLPIKNYIKGFYLFIKSKKVFSILFIIIWILNFNGLTIILEALAYYFYFIFSFDFAHLYLIIYKLCLDLLPMFKTIPWYIFILLLLVVLYKLRLKIAYLRLDHYEMRNRGFINDLGQVVLICGTMGKGKTSIMSDMCLSQEVMFRDKAFELILEIDLKFSYFPYINLENAIKKVMDKHIVYNLSTLSIWLKKIEVKFNKSKLIKDCFCYDYLKYGLYFNDALRSIYLFDSLEDYAKLYFIYITTSSLLTSNYGIRVDSILSSVGNFPLWNSDFFKRDPRLEESFSRHSHILDFDSLRIGKKVIKNNIKANSFEFGVVVISEVGKERGNMLDMQEIKYNSKDTNQKNDLFNLWLKMARHSSTINNYPFIKVFMDEQRPESLGADARELCEKIIYIKEKQEKKNHLILFIFETIINDFLISKYRNLYYQYRFNRSDNTLLIYLLKSLVSKFNKHYLYLDNTFSYYTLSLEYSKYGSSTSLEEAKYYLQTKKIYSNRFSTDAFSDYFKIKTSLSSLGLSDLEEYRNTRASLDELSNQNSYFIDKLLDNLEDK